MHYTIIQPPRPYSNDQSLVYVPWSTMPLYMTLSQCRYLLPSSFSMLSLPDIMCFMALYAHRHVLDASLHVLDASLPCSFCTWVECPVKLWSLIYDHYALIIEATKSNDPYEWRNSTESDLSMLKLEPPAYRPVAAFMDGLSTGLDNHLLGLIIRSRVFMSATDVLVMGQRLLTSLSRRNHNGWYASKQGR